jgi:hypothetical protein
VLSSKVARRGASHANDLRRRRWSQAMTVNASTQQMFQLHAFTKIRTTELQRPYGVVSLKLVKRWVSSRSVPECMNKRIYSGAPATEGHRN